MRTSHYLDNCNKETQLDLEQNNMPIHSISYTATWPPIRVRNTTETETLVWIFCRFGIYFKATYSLEISQRRNWGLMNEKMEEIMTHACMHGHEILHLDWWMNVMMNWILFIFPLILQLGGLIVKMFACCIGGANFNPRLRS